MSIFDKKKFSKVLFKSYVNDDPIENTISWIEKIRGEVNVEIKRVDFNELENWNCDENQIYHSSNKFFSIIGVDVRNDFKRLDDNIKSTNIRIKLMMIREAKYQNFK